jgi:hypothetical protein
MSSLAPELGDAVRPDGTLKDASEIIWSYDADELIPFPLGSTHSILSTRLSPATMVGGVRWTSSRIHRPSQRALEAAEASSSTRDGKRLGIKRKASGNCLDDRGPRRGLVDVDVVNVDDTGVYDNGASDAETRPPTEPASDNDYEALRAMADTDNAVHCQPPSLRINVSLDIRLQPSDLGRSARPTYRPYLVAKKR